MTIEGHGVEATGALLQSGAIMLGTALVFVTLFRKLKLGATLGYIVAGALIGPQLLGLIGFEVFGQFTRIVEERDAFFRHTIGGLARTVGLRHAGAS